MDKRYNEMIKAFSSQARKFFDAGHMLATRLLQSDVQLDDEERAAMDMFLPTGKGE